MRRTLSLLLVASLTLVGCSAGDEEPDAGPTSSSPAAPSPSESSPPEPSEPAEPSAPTTPTAPAEPAEDPLPPVTNELSLPALMREPLTGRGLRVTRTVTEQPGYTQQEITYRSDDLTISGELFRPTGRGPFPAIVLNHGYIDPAYYETGQGLAREQLWLVQAGYVVLHTDYRGHATSDDVPQVDLESRLGYARDAANAVRALRQQPYVDGERVGMLGRSMGGGVTQNVLVAYPGLVDAAVVYASVSSDFVENVRQFTEPNRPEAAQGYYDRFGTPRSAPEFYDGLSPRTYFDRITEPVLSLHGAVDATCPPRWARDTQRLMTRAGVDATLELYDGEDHTFYSRWEDSIRRSDRFFERHL
ncbi:alpha/beta hydrolase family protein [Nocardioides dongxiaopingii]|uniref:alpha/beta hydrolase family protein n=1 Tax=Nocardioides dongxiaopingii TaxID=2576036 RepID=UPI001BB0C708|nr:alpha/beta fold hydrolase [Nocardioides dongxiaopingii]